MTTTHTFRMDDRILRQLGTEAQTRGLSMNALHNQILQLYFETISNVRRLSYLSVEGGLLQNLLETADESEASQLAQLAGRKHIPELILTSRKELSHEGLMFILERVLCAGCGWARFSKEVTADGCVVTLTHKFGKVWSRFLVDVVSAAFDGVAKSKPCFNGVSDSVVVFKVLDRTGSACATAF